MVATTKLPPPGGQTGDPAVVRGDERLVQAARTAGGADTASSPTGALQRTTI